MDLPLIAALKQRRVFRALAGYALAAFAVLQISEPLMHGLHWPEAALTWIVAALLLGFPVAIAVAFILDVRAGATGGGRLAWTLAAALVAAAAGGLIWFRMRAAPVAPPPASIAVLPFVNMSSDKETDYFSEGITEELINALASVEGLRVASRTAVFALRGKDLGVAQLGEQLHVGMLLEGSVRREGSAVRITAQLVAVADGYHLWSKTWDRELRGVFAVEDEIARSIAASLRRTIAGVKAGTADVEAHDLFLKGRFFLNKRTGEGLRAATGFFEAAIARDPSYALAWAGLADSLTLRIDYDEAPAAEMLPKAERAALRALELDPSSGEAHASLGLIAYKRQDWRAALDELRKATELSADDAMAWKWMADALVQLGRLDEARSASTRALQLDPTSLVVNNHFGVLLKDLRDYDGAAAQLLKTLELDPGFEMARINLAMTRALQGRYSEALAEENRLQRFPQAGRDILRGWILARAGRRNEALALARQVEAAPRQKHAVGLAVLWATLGDREKAFVLLKQACERNELGEKLNVAAIFDPLRADPRFREIVRCAKLE